MKQLRVPSFVCAVVALLLVASSCGSDSSSDSTVIASIAGRELTRGQLDDLLPDGDNTVDQDGIRFLMDRKSTIYLKGIVLDYQVGLNSKGFVFKNPNASSTCGCGESFSV